MPISGIVLTLSQHEGEQASTLSHMARDGRITLGQRQGLHMAVVTETKTMTGHKRLWHELRALGGVSQLRLVFCSFEDVDAGKGK